MLQLNNLLIFLMVYHQGKWNTTMLKKIQHFTICIYKIEEFKLSKSLIYWELKMLETGVSIYKWCIKMSNI